MNSLTDDEIDDSEKQYNMYIGFLLQEANAEKAQLKHHPVWDVPSISTAIIQGIVDRLKHQQHRDSTKANYYSIWRQFNRIFYQA